MQKKFINYLVVKKIKDCNNLYVKTNVLLLADASASYRKNLHNSFGLDPLYCIPALGFFNRAMLKMTNIEIKLITDSNIHFIIEKGIRRGSANLYIIMQKQIINTSILISIKKR